MMDWKRSKIKSTLQKMPARKHVILLMGVLILLIPFQNCRPVGEVSQSSVQSVDGNSDSSSGPDQRDNDNNNNNNVTCEYSTNRAPVINRLELRKNDNLITSNLQNDGGTFNINVGMDQFSGNDQDVSLTVFASTSGDGSEVVDQTIDDFDCDESSEDFNVNCNDDFEDQGNGRFRGEINITPETECFNGTVSVDIQVADLLLNCENGPDSQSSNTVTISITGVDQCLPTSRKDSPTPENLGGLGARVTMDGNFAIAAAPNEDDIEDNDGLAHVYQKQGSDWNHVDTLRVQDAQVDGTGDGIVGVAIDGTTAAIGAVNNSGHGAAYVFQRSGGSWNYVTKLVPSDGVSGDNFGEDISISSGRIAVGAWGHDLTRGKVYVYSGSNFSNERAIVPDQRNTTAYFGKSVSLDGNLLAVGAPGDDSAYVFDLSSSTYQQVTGGPRSDFGHSLALSGDRLFVGAPQKTVDDNAKSGEAYIYRLDGTWGLETTLNQEDPGNEDLFGYSINFGSDRIVVGASRKNLKTGAVYIFDNSGTQIYKLRARSEDRDQEDRFGSGVAANDNGDLIVGAEVDDYSQGGSFYRDAGAVYFVRLP